MTSAGKLAVDIAHPSGPHNGFSLISNEKLVQLYVTMLKCSMLEERISNLKRRDPRATSGERFSQEAAAVGVGVDLVDGDTLAPSTGGWIHAFVKGLHLERIVAAHAGGKPAGRSPYAQLNVVPPSLNLGEQINRAIQAARENKKRRNKKIVAAFCGNSCESPTLDEAMRLAGKARLPILLVCHSRDDNNEDICNKAQQYGFPGVAVDGNDAVAVYRVVTEAMAHARRGSGPTLIELKPWPLASRALRTAGKPVLNMERYLKRKGLFSRKLKSVVVAEFGRELDAATQTVLGRSSRSASS